ncbi:DUF5946 family protein [Methanobacterium sp.]|jgi:hypothetical protein|uniref:DUF5946 family protein n=1 Tax=Methanobacterium sp. TaxID=2164 RepID=UPI003158A5B5
MKTAKSEPEMFYKLSCYTQTHPDPSFIHQYAVNAFAAQYADENTKPITITFALIGLYLHIEKDFSGREVQIAHVKLAKHRKEWPKFDLPVQRGYVTVYDVLEAPRGHERGEMIQRWCISVWDAYRDSHKKVADLVQTELYDRQKKRKNLRYNPE